VHELPPSDCATSSARTLVAGLPALAELLQAEGQAAGGGVLQGGSSTRVSSSLGRARPRPARDSRTATRRQAFARAHAVGPPAWWRRGLRGRQCGRGLAGCRGAGQVRPLAAGNRARGLIGEVDGRIAELGRQPRGAGAARRGRRRGVAEKEARRAAEEARQAEEARGPRRRNGRRRRAQRRQRKRGSPRRRRAGSSRRLPRPRPAVPAWRGGCGRPPRSCGSATATRSAS
jgi:hypothetical protein